MPVLIERNRAGEVVGVVLDFTPSFEETYMYYVPPPYTGAPGVNPIQPNYPARIQGVTLQLLSHELAVDGIKKSTVLTAEEKSSALNAITGENARTAIYFGQDDVKYLVRVAAIAGASAAVSAFKMNPGLRVFLDP